MTANSVRMATSCIGSEQQLIQDGIRHTSYSVRGLPVYAVPTPSYHHQVAQPMPIFKIEPMDTTTRGGHLATITGINTGSTDFIVGTITGAARKKDVSWDESGLCRDNEPSCNLDTQSNEFIEVKRAASVFGK